MARLDTLWYTRSGVPTAVGVAVQLGWFEQEFARDGIALRSIRDATEPLVRRSHYDHSQQNSFRQGGSVPAIWARASGRDTRLIGLTWTDESQVILTRPGSGISSVKDLKGRRLAVATRSDVVVDYWAATTERVYELALETVGLGLNDVELVRLPTDHSFDRPLEVSLLPADADALLRGDVDAIFNKGPRGLELAHALGAHVVFDTREVPEVRVRANHHSPRTLTVDGHLADHHPDIVVRILKHGALGERVGHLAPARRSGLRSARDEHARALGARRVRSPRQPAPLYRSRRRVDSRAHGVHSLSLPTPLPPCPRRGLSLARPTSARRGAKARRALGAIRGGSLD